MPRKRKILTPDICKRGESCADLDGKFLTTTTIYGIMPKREGDFYFLLAILNSTLLNYFIKNTGSILRGDFIVIKQLIYALSQ